MPQISLEEAQHQFSLLLKQAMTGEEVMILKNNKAVAKLVAVHQPKTKPQFGSAKGLITMSDDFDEPLNDFKDYVECEFCSTPRPFSGS